MGRIGAQTSDLKRDSENVLLIGAKLAQAHSPADGRSQSLEGTGPCGGFRPAEQRRARSGSAVRTSIHPPCNVAAIASAFSRPPTPTTSGIRRIALALIGCPSSSTLRGASLSPLEAMLVYKQCGPWSGRLRTTKSLLQTRRVHHKLDETIRGRVACSFLALALKKELEDRLAAANNAGRASSPDVIADLDLLTRPSSSRTASASCCAPRRQPRAFHPRRLPAADVAPDRRRFSHSELMYLPFAAALARRAFAFPIDDFASRLSKNRLAKEAESLNGRDRSSCDIFGMMLDCRRHYERYWSRPKKWRKDRYSGGCRR